MGLWCVAKDGDMAVRGVALVWDVDVATPTSFLLKGFRTPTLSLLFLHKRYWKIENFCTFAVLDFLSDGRSLK